MNMFGISLIIRTVVMSSVLIGVSPMIGPDLSPSKAEVDDQGRYQGLIVAINYRMSKNSISETEYLDNIKNEVSDLSKLIHETIGLQFGEVTILVPSYWRAKGYTTAFSEAPESADMLIQPLDDPSLATVLNDSAIAYTRHIQPCGMQGLRLVVDAGFMKDKNRSAQKTKVLLHQWMHLRYGVFDEYPLINSGAADVDKQKFYHSSESIEPVRCGLSLKTETDCKIKGKLNYKDIDPLTYLPKRSCSFKVKAPQSNSPSLMSNYELDNVKDICDKQTHNRQAPNRQNRLCSSRSVSEVLQTHKDFKRIGLSKEPGTTFTPPMYVIKRMRESRTVVFVLDSSNSMKEENRLYLAKQAIEHMLSIVLEDNVNLLIVRFDLHAYQVFPTDLRQGVGKLSSKAARAEAIRSLSRIVLGPDTCIGCGLRRAYDTIYNATGTVQGTYFILLTDGADTKPKRSNLKEIFNRSRLESFFIDTILLSNEADNTLINLAKKSGSAIFSAVAYSSSLVEAYTEMVTNRQNTTGRIVQIHSMDEKVRPREEISGRFVVEKHLNQEAKISFFWVATAQPHLSFVVLREGSSTPVVNTSATQYNSGQLTVSLVDNDMEVRDGESLHYIYRISNNHPSVTFEPTVKVSARPNNEIDGNTDARRKRRNSVQDVERDYYQEYGMEAFVRSENAFWFSSESKVPDVSIHAYLPPGSTPSAPYNVCATLTISGIEENTTSEIHIQLMDSGTGADIIKNDGIYSSYFSQYMTYNATYYVRVRAEGPGFMRYASTGYFTVYMEPGLNVAVTLPPALINDVQVMELEDNRVTLKFTATGADLDYKKADHYKLWYSANYDDMRDSGSVSNNIAQKILKHKPKEPGTVEEIVVDLPTSMMDSNQTIWLAITAVDEHELESNTSNLVSARNLRSLPNQTPVEETIIDNKPTPDTIIKGLDNLYFFIILGSLGVLIILILLIILIACCCRRKRNTDEEKTTPAPYYSTAVLDPDDDEYKLGSDLAEHDMVYMTNTQINTFHRKPLPSTKKRVKSINWKASIKRITSTSKKRPAPPIPTKENGYVNSPPVATVQPVQRKPTEYITAQRQNAKPMIVNTNNMADDLAYAANIAKAVVRKDSALKSDDAVEDVPC